MRHHSTDRLKVEIPDVQSQYEELLDTLWRCEDRARLEDRIAARTRFEELQSRRCSRRQ